MIKNHVSGYKRNFTLLQTVDFKYQNAKSNLVLFKDVYLIYVSEVL